MSYDRPPGPDGLPLIGNTARVVRDRLAFLEECATEYGDVVYRNVGFNDSYMVTHPDDIEQILKYDDDKYEKFGFSNEQTERACGTLVDTSELSFEERQENWQPAFTRSKIEGYAETMVDHTERLLDSWTDGQRIDVNDEMRELVLAITLETLFGGRYEGDLTALSEAFQQMIPRFGPTKQPIPDWVPTPTNYRYKQGRSFVESTLDEFVSDRTGESGPADDLLGMLVEGYENGEMSADFLQDELLTMLVASHETTTFALTLTWHLLGTHPSVLDRLHAEVDEAFDGSPTVEDLSALQYTDWVVREAMRLYPPVYSLPRIPRQDVEIAGYPVPEGSFVFMPQWIVHRDERFYDDPEAFRPARWEHRDRPEFAYFPFSGGPRGCVGEQFAWVELRLVVATVAAAVRLDVSRTEPPDVAAGITLQLEDDVTATVVER